MPSTKHTHTTGKPQRNNNEIVTFIGFLYDIPILTGRKLLKIRKASQLYHL